MYFVNKCRDLCPPTPRFQPAIELVSSGKVDVKPLITHHYNLEDGLKAFEAAKTGQGIKIMINCDKTKN